MTEYYDTTQIWSQLNDLIEESTDDGASPMEIAAVLYSATLKIYRDELGKEGFIEMMGALEATNQLAIEEWDIMSDALN